MKRDRNGIITRKARRMSCIISSSIISSIALAGAVITTTIASSSMCCLAFTGTPTIMTTMRPKFGTRSTYTMTTISSVLSSSTIPMSGRRSSPLSSWENNQRYASTTTLLLYSEGGDEFIHDLNLYNDTQSYTNKNRSYSTSTSTEKKKQKLPPKQKSERPRILDGFPSNPGWKTEELNQLTNWAVSSQANRPIICEYEPDALWLWSKWRGTVLSLTIIPVCLSMLAASLITYGVHELSAMDWHWYVVPPRDDPWIVQLEGVNKLWEYQLTLCTFILTFFTSEAYRHWKSVYFTTRAIQGRVNDICLLITLAAERGECTEWGNCANDGSGECESENIGLGYATGYSESAAKLVRLCTRLIKLSHAFFWAATPTFSDGIMEVDDEDTTAHEARRDDWARQDDIGPLLLSPDGLDRLIAEGELTKTEKQALLGSELPPSQYTYVLLEWVGLHVMNGLQTGVLKGGNGFEENILRQITALRGEYFNIGDMTSGRMVLAYVQLVQVLVDSLCVIAPFALYPELGGLVVPLAGLFTLFFKGQLELSKSFLDPFGVEGYPGQNIRTDVIVSELNFGAGKRWVKAAESLPTDIDTSSWLPYRKNDTSTVTFREG